MSLKSERRLASNFYLLMFGLLLSYISPPFLNAKPTLLLTEALDHIELDSSWTPWEILHGILVQDLDTPVQCSKCSKYIKYNETIHNLWQCPFYNKIRENTIKLLLSLIKHLLNKNQVDQYYETFKSSDSIAKMKIILGLSII